MDLEAKILPTAALDKKDIDRMFSLIQDYFDGYERQRFEHDLQGKDEVLLLYNSRIEGFTTIQFLQLSYPQDCRAIFSGDTIVDKAYWGQQQLGPTWIRRMLDKKDEADTPLYWFLISSGYKTYRFLPTYFEDFYPRHDLPTPPQTQLLLDTLANERYADQYDKQRGTIIFNDSSERLKPETSPIPDRLLTNPHVRFYLEKNPSHALGHELACIAEISRANFKESVLRRL